MPQVGNATNPWSAFGGIDPWSYDFWQTYSGPGATVGLPSTPAPASPTGRANPGIPPPPRRPGGGFAPPGYPGDGFGPAPPPGYQPPAPPPPPPPPSADTYVPPPSAAPPATRNPTTPNVPSGISGSLPSMQKNGAGFSPRYSGPSSYNPVLYADPTPLPQPAAPTAGTPGQRGRSGIVNAMMTRRNRQNDPWNSY